MRYVVANFLVELVAPSFVMLLGYDRELVPLEVGGPPVASAESADTALRIVHAMRARPAFRRMLEHLLT